MLGNIGENQVVPVKVEMDFQSVEREAESNNDFEHVSLSSFLGETRGHVDESTSRHDYGDSRREASPSPRLVSTRQETPCRVITRSRNVPKDTSNERQKRSKEILLSWKSRGAALQNGDFRLQTNSCSKSQEGLFRKLCSKLLMPCGSFILRKLKTVAAYFGPGLILAYVIYWTMVRSSVGTPVNTSTSTELISLMDRQADFDEMYYSTPQDSQFCPGDPQFVINLSTQCQLKNQECQEMVELLEHDNSNLRQQLSENLALEEERLVQNGDKYDRLVKAVMKFRLDRFCILKSSFYQYLFGFVVSSISLICFIVHYFKRIILF